MEQDSETLYTPLKSGCRALSNRISHVPIFQPIQKLDGGFWSPPWTLTSQKRLGSRGLRRPYPLSSFRFNDLIHSLFVLLTSNLIFHISRHFLSHRVLWGSRCYPKENFEKLDGNISQSFDNLWGRNWLLRLSRSHFQAVWGSGNYDVDHIWTRPDPPHFPKIVTRPNPTRPAGRPDPWTTLIGYIFHVPMLTFSH